MAKTRLNLSGRLALRELAGRLIRCPIEQARLDAAYARAACMVSEDLCVRFPQHDMRVLQKYDMARADHCIRLQPYTGCASFFEFDHGDDKTPILPGRDGRCIRTVYAETMEAVYEWAEARDDLKKAVFAKLKDYHALIEFAPDFQSVVAVWPEAEQVRSKCRETSRIVGISATAMARIQQDIAARMAVAVTAGVAA